MSSATMSSIPVSTSRISGRGTGCAGASASIGRRWYAPAARLTDLCAQGATERAGNVARGDEERIEVDTMREPLSLEQVHEVLGGVVAEQRVEDRVRVHEVSIEHHLEPRQQRRPVEPQVDGLEGLEAKWDARWETDGTYRFGRCMIDSRMRDLRRDGHIVPLFCGSAELTYGLRTLLKKMVELFPSPAEVARSSTLPQWSPSRRKS